MARFLLCVDLLNRISRRTRPVFIFWKEWECSTGRTIKAPEIDRISIGIMKRYHQLMGLESLNNCTVLACSLNSRSQAKGQSNVKEATSYRQPGQLQWKAVPSSRPEARIPSSGQIP